MKKTVFQNIIFNKKSLQSSNPEDSIIINCKGIDCDIKEYI